MEQQGLFEGRRRRDAGMTQVETNNADWAVIARSAAEEWLGRAMPGDQFTGEVVRLYVRQRINQSPKHPNAWGAVVGGAIRRWIRTGAVRRVGLGQAHDPRSHASMLPLYEVI